MPLDLWKYEHEIECIKIVLEGRHPNGFYKLDCEFTEDDPEFDRLLNFIGEQDEVRQHRLALEAKSQLDENKWERKYLELKAKYEPDS